MTGPSLRPSVSAYRRKPNAWWYKLTAISFLIKVAIIVAIFLGLKYASSAADDADPAPASAESR